MQNKRTWLYLILMLILFTLICAQQQQINDLRDDLSTLQEQTVHLECVLYVGHVGGHTGDNYPAASGRNR